MEPEERSLFARLIGLTTAITAVVTAVVLASVAGSSAYLAFQPSSLEAQALAAESAQLSTSPTVTTASACQQEIATAAARGTPDTQFSITDQSSLTFQDTCVAAVLSPSAASLGPNNPGSYMCVGKNSTVNIVGAGVISETAVPNRAVPAGTCIAVACGTPGVGGASSCIAANNLTSLTGTNIQSMLSTAPSAVTSDQGITSFTMNADGDIVDSSGNASSILDSGLGDQGLAGNSVSLDQSAQAQTSIANSGSGDPTSIGETQAVSAQPSEVPTVSPNTANSAASQTSASGSANADVSADTSATQASDASNQATPSTQRISAVSDKIGVDGPQPTEPTLNANARSTDLVNSDGTVNIQSPSNSAGLIEEPAAGSQSWIDKFGSALTHDGITVVNDVRGWFGFGPLDFSAPPVQGSIDAVGIRG